MNAQQAVWLDEERCRALEEELVDRIYEFNAQATGYRDGRLIGAAIRNEAGHLVAGYSGHTWGACCVITHLWVEERSRGRGLGRGLLDSAVEEAVRRACRYIIVSTHTFQAPGFYERMGFDRVATVADWPKGHSAATYRRRLPCRAHAMQLPPNERAEGGA